MDVDVNTQDVVTSSTLPEPGRSFWWTFSRAHISQTDRILDSGQAAIKRAGLSESLDVEVADLTQLLLDVKRRKNLCTPVNRIPPELLRHTFSIVTAACPAKLKSRGGDLGWIVLAHVCQYWRQVILYSADLWAQIVCEFPVARDEIFTRAKAAPLHLNLGRDSAMASNEEFNQAFARRHLHRVKVLSLCLPQKAWPAFAETLASSEWGWLEKLDIDLKERHPAPFRTLRPVNAPSLYYLKMRNCSIPFTTPNLTHLDFTLDGGEEESLPTPDELIMMLNQCRGLETLRLWKTVPDMTQRRDKRLYATLPYLSKLTLCSSPQRIEALVAQMIFPNWTHITLDLNYIKDAFPSPETDPKDADKITLEQGISTVETIRKRVELYGYDAGFVPDATGMILHPSRDNRFAFFDDDEPDDAFLDVTMHKTGRAETESLVDLCRTLHARFNLSGITRATIGSRYESEEDWKEIYLLFPNIVDLKVDEFGNHSSIPAIEILEPVSPPDTMELDGDSSLKSEQKGLVPLPFLAVLRFQSVYYRLEDDNKHFNRLEKILKARATIGASLHKLDIGRFDKDSVSKYRRAKEEKIVAFRQELLDRLGKIVPEVVGDPRLDLPKWALLDDDLVEDEEDENDEEASIADSYY